MPLYVDPELTDGLGDPTWFNDKAKNASPNSTTFNALSQVTVPIGAVAASLTNSQIAAIALPKPCKIKAVSVAAATYAGTIGVNLQYGVGSSTGVVGDGGAIAPANTPVFSVTQVVAANTAAVQVFVPDNPDVIYGPAGTPDSSQPDGLPLVVVANTLSGSGATGLGISIAIEPVDLYPSVIGGDPNADY